MTIAYDVDIENHPYKSSKYTAILQQFRKQTDHENISMNFEDIRNAIRVQKAFCEYRNKHRIHDVTVVRRGSVLILIKNSEF